jgi:hypothetical protein
LEVKLQAVNVLDLAMMGKVPAPLVSALDELIADGTVEVSVEVFEDLAPVINDVVLLAVVDPPVAVEADAEHVGVGELPALDRLAIFNWSNAASGAAELVPFRPEQVEPVDTA